MDRPLWQLEVIERLTRIEGKVEPVAGLVVKVDALEASRDKATGMVTALSALWALLTGLFTWHVWSRH